MSYGQVAETIFSDSTLNRCAAVCVPAAPGVLAAPPAADAEAPDWLIEQNEDFWFAPPDDDPMVDVDGYPIEPAPPEVKPDVEEEEPPPREEGPGDRLDREWLERAITRPRPPDRAPPPRERERERERAVKDEN